MQALLNLSEWLLPLSAFCFVVVYPSTVVAWTVYDAMVASQRAEAWKTERASNISKEKTLSKLCVDAQTRVQTSARWMRVARRLSRRLVRTSATLRLVLVGVCFSLVTVVVMHAPSFMLAQSGVYVRRDVGAQSAAIGHSFECWHSRQNALSSARFHLCAALGLSSLVWWIRGYRAARVVVSGAGTPSVKGLYNGRDEQPCLVHQHKCPDPLPHSMWHDVELRADAVSCLYHCVNEMPLGSLQKFEVVTDVPGNPILEDTDSTKFASFGHPLPFNYGCFPQTFRDPEETEVHGTGATGDNDPLDILDLCTAAVDPGVVFTCRPLAAVSLIHEHWADWKILAVNTESSDPLASASCIEDVVRIRPGRLEEVLQWIYDFKKTSSTSAVLNFEIHDAKEARAAIERDHRSWQRLVAQPSVDGFARGHWIGPGTRNSESRRCVSSALNRDDVDWFDPSVAIHTGAHAHFKLVSRHVQP